MKINKWYEKVEKIFTENADKILAAENTEDGAYFTLDGYVLYFLPGQHIMGVKPTIFKNGLSAAFGENANLADSLTHGEIVNFNHNGKPRKAIKLEVNAGNKVAYIQEKFTKDLPKNTDYYVTSMNRPVLAYIWDNNILNPVAAICPVIVDNTLHTEFIAYRKERKG